MKITKLSNGTTLIDVGRTTHSVCCWFNLRSWGVSVTICHELFEVQFLCFFLQIVKYKRKTR